MNDSVKLRVLDMNDSVKLRVFLIPCHFESSTYLSAVSRSVLGAVDGLLGECRYRVFLIPCHFESSTYLLF
jgi:hypothetical protein